MTLRKRSHNEQLMFPLKLHQLLADAEIHGFYDIVSWLDGSGKAFKVHDPEAFESLLSHRYFSQHHYKSFQRQLNIYGFKRILSGRHKGGYFHELFVRGNPDLCHLMIRTKLSRNKTRSYCKVLDTVDEKETAPSVEELSKKALVDEGYPCEVKSIGKGFIQTTSPHMSIERLDRQKWLDLINEVSIKHDPAVLLSNGKTCFDESFHKRDEVSPVSMEGFLPFLPICSDDDIDDLLVNYDFSE